MNGYGTGCVDSVGGAGKFFGVVVVEAPVVGRLRKGSATTVVKSEGTPILGMGRFTEHRNLLGK